MEESMYACTRLRACWNKSSVILSGPIKGIIDVNREDWLIGSARGGAQKSAT